MSDLQMTITSWGVVMVDKREMSKLMRSAGNSVKTKTSRLINASDGGGRPTHRRGVRTFGYRSSLDVYRASVPGQPPVRASGTLRSSLKTYVYKSGEGFAVRAREFYALFLEAGATGGGNPFGGRPEAAAAWRAKDRSFWKRGHRRKHAKGRYTTRVLEPRPFLDRVFDQEAPDIERRMRDAITHALTWKETKAK